ncbi:MAG: ABC transporter permease [Flavobacteriaceae bacterium]|nr:ABC transporter permease [Flavobacteriaceae bacterium]
MNFEFFLAKRIISSKSYKSSVSAPIIKIGITAIAIGIIVMLVTIATNIGLQQKIRDKAVAFNGHITITAFDSNLSNESENPIDINQEFYPIFSSVDGIKHIQAVANKFGLIRTATDFDGVVFKGVGQEYDWQYFKEYLVAGKLPTYDETYSNEVVISEYLSNRLRLKVGDKFEMIFNKKDINQLPHIRKFRVSGIYNSGFLELDKTYLLGDIKHVQRLNKWKKNQIGNFEVFISDYSLLASKGVEVYKAIPSLLDSKTVRRKYADIFEWIDIFDKNIYGIIGIMVLVAGINMITALLVLILERTQMIGILKALGSNNWMIRKVFLYNASYLIILGLFWGNAIGLGLMFAQKYLKLFALDPSVYYVTEVPVYLSFGSILALNIGTFIICFVMLIIPSVIVTKISPVKAMRFE